MRGRSIAAAGRTSHWVLNAPRWWSHYGLQSAIASRKGSVVFACSYNLESVIVASAFGTAYAVYWRAEA